MAQTQFRRNPVKTYPFSKMLQVLFEVKKMKGNRRGQAAGLGGVDRQ